MHSLQHRPHDRRDLQVCVIHWQARPFHDRGRACGLILKKTMVTDPESVTIGGELQ